jgi:nitrile hydratase subunit alpha
MHEHARRELSELEVRARALEALLLERGLLTEDAVDDVVEAYERDIGPLNGATVVARAWRDDAFRRRLLEAAVPAIAELGIGGLSSEHIRVVENTPAVHNVVVCTLCSCYPWALLGVPPNWYKSPPYRSRMVREPRTVLAELGVEVPESVEVRVWDSSSELRYMVLPRPPRGSEVLSEAELRDLVTRDSMIGVATLDSSPWA